MDSDFIDYGTIETIKKVGKLRSKERYFDHIYQIFVNQARENISKLEEAIQEHRYKDVGYFAHRLKGSCLSIGAFGLAEDCEKIERTSDADERHPHEFNELYQKLNGAFVRSCDLLSRELS